MKPNKWLYHLAVKKFTENNCGLTIHNIWQNIELDKGLMKLDKHGEFLTGLIDFQPTILNPSTPIFNHGNV